MSRTIMAAVLVAALAPALPARAGAPQRSRTFDLTYTAEVPQVKGAAPVRLWLPVPRSGPDQTVSEPQVTAPAPARITHESVHGNRVLHVEIPAERTPAVVAWKVRATRKESRGESALPREERARIRQYLDADRLGVVAHPEVDHKLQLAMANRGRNAPIARAIYDEVLASMKYDKKEPGWGRGDTLRACRVGKGNCSDFHALFISMCRRADTPAKFAIGLALPAERGSGAISGYHCWAYFLSPATTWVPVDASEAWKDGSRRDYFFGALTEHRIELSQGRDLVLEPKQAGAPLNFFVDPYAEQDGQPVPVVRKASYQDLP